MRIELRAICAELRHEILKLDPIRHAQGCPLLGGMAIKCDCISRWTKGNALQYSILSFLRDLRRFYSGCLFQKFGGNGHNFSLPSTMLQALENFFELFGACGQIYPLALIAQVPSENQQGG